VPDQPPARRAPSDYRPDLRPMLILFALLAAVVVGWIVIGPSILPRGTQLSPATDQLDGEWMRADDGRGVTLDIADGGYDLRDAPEFSGSGTAVIYQGELILSEDPGCPDRVGRYEISADTLDGAGDAAGRLTLTLIEDACGNGARAEAVSGNWVLSGAQ
jgi:hypothetical protein